MVKLNRKYTWLWIIWILMFACIEWSALRDKAKGDTLSEHVWKVIGTNMAKGSPGRNWENWLFRGLLAGGFIWVIPHFFTGWNL